MARTRVGQLLEKVLELPQLRDLITAQAIPAVIVIALNFLTAAVLGPPGKGKATFMIMAGATGAYALFGSMHVGAVQALRSRDTSAGARALVAVLGMALLPWIGALYVWQTGQQVGPAFLRSNDLALVLVGMGFATLALFALRTIQGLALSRKYSRLSILTIGTYALATVAALPLGLTPNMLVGAWVLSQAVSAVTALWVLGKEVSLTRLKGTGESVLRPALAAHLGNVGNYWMFRADLLLLGVLGASSADIGIYGVATAAAEMLLLIAEPFSLAVFAEGRSRLDNKERSQRIDHHIRLYLRVGALAMVAAIAGGWFIFRIVLPEYWSSFGLLLVLLPGVWMGGVGRIRLSGVFAAGSQRLALVAGISSVVGTALYFPMIKIFGVYGAAMTSSLLYLAYAVLLQTIMSRHLFQIQSGMEEPERSRPPEVLGGTR